MIEMNLKNAKLKLAMCERLLTRGTQKDRWYSMMQKRIAMDVGSREGE
jgi:hypothetical protein